ncbi:MAG: alpha/beta hydrolase [Rikenellaceae bacterium]|jgi:acetyl esterase/lipase|nr:alpha/beta hydrolase [Rikenellaceae bacterium]
MKKILLLLLAMAGMCVAAQEPIEMLLYPDGAPDDNGIAIEQQRWNEAGTSLQMVAVPKMYVYLPPKEKATGRAVVICPGGGYGAVAMYHEGHDVARWMTERGIAGIVLQYRMPNGHREIPLNDAHAAIRTVRAQAAKWNIDPAKVGIMGFSAGGHLASTATVWFEKDTRPDFAILMYPVISLEAGLAHIGSRGNLLGPPPEGALNNPGSGYMQSVRKYSTYTQGSSQTPPTFIALSDDDRSVPPTNGALFYIHALKEHGVAGELHIYPTGGHGWGWRETFAYKDELRTSLARWLGRLP